MLWLKIAGGIVVLVVAYVAVAGAVVARGHVTAVRIALKRPPAEVFAALADPVAQTQWRPDLKSVELLPPQDGRTVYRETTRMGPVRYVVDESVAGKRRVARILDEDLGYRGRWVFELEPDGAGTRLTITEEGEMTSWMFRALSPFFSKTATLEAYLKALAAKFGEVARPEVARRA
jgi:uncharacterized protein YndB with AHSA1/START domain